MEDKDAISSVNRALDILLLFNEQKRALGVSEIASFLGVYKSTIHRTLVTLERKGFVEQNKESGKYWLGIKLYALGATLGEKMTLKESVRPFLEKLASIFNEMVNLSVLDTSDPKNPMSVIILKAHRGTQILTVNPSVGSSNTVYCSSVGKCLVAFSKENILENMKECTFKAYTPNTMQTYEAYVKEIEIVRKQGFAYDNQEQELGLTCIGCPIFDKNGQVVAAFSISGPTFRMETLDKEYIIKTLKEIASEITLYL